MSKYVKNLIAGDLSKRLEGVQDAILVDVIGLNSQNTFNLRKELREKGLNLLVVKNSMARRATEGTSLAPAFDGVRGSLAVMWGAEDFISLAKEFVALTKPGKFDKLESRGGVMDGERLSPERVKEVSKWPNREQQLSILMGQILSPGARLQSQLLAPGGKLASQIKKKGEGEEGEAVPEPGEGGGTVAEAAEPAPAEAPPAAS